MAARNSGNYSEAAPLPPSTPPSETGLCPLLCEAPVAPAASHPYHRRFPPFVPILRSVIPDRAPCGRHGACPPLHTAPLHAHVPQPCAAWLWLVQVPVPAPSPGASSKSSTSTDMADDDAGAREEPRGCFWRICSCFYKRSGDAAPPQHAVVPMRMIETTAAVRACVIAQRPFAVMPRFLPAAAPRVHEMCVCSVCQAPARVSLLPPLLPQDAAKKCLVLDLDETLVHSSFKPISKPDYIIPVEIEDVVHHVYVRKRPHCDAFLRVAAKHYEIVVFTASLSKYANPLLDKLDTGKVIRSRLFREHCVYHMVRGWTWGTAAVCRGDGCRANGMQALCGRVRGLAHRPRVSR